MDSLADSCWGSSGVLAIPACTRLRRTAGGDRNEGTKPGAGFRAASARSNSLRLAIKDCHRGMVRFSQSPYVSVPSINFNSAGQTAKLIVEHYVLVVADRNVPKLNPWNRWTFFLHIVSDSDSDFDQSAFSVTSRALNHFWVFYPAMSGLIHPLLSQGSMKGIWVMQSFCTPVR